MRGGQIVCDERLRVAAQRDMGGWRGEVRGAERGSRGRGCCVVQAECWEREDRARAACAAVKVVQSRGESAELVERAGGKKHGVWRSSSGCGLVDAARGSGAARGAAGSASALKLIGRHCGGWLQQRRLHRSAEK